MMCRWLKDGGRLPEPSGDDVTRVSVADMKALCMAESGGGGRLKQREGMTQGRPGSDRIWSVTGSDQSWHAGRPKRKPGRPRNGFVG